jgi:hypothetical protein
MVIELRTKQRLTMIFFHTSPKKDTENKLQTFSVDIPLTLLPTAYKINDSCVSQCSLFSSRWIRPLTESTAKLLLGTTQGKHLDDRGHITQGKEKKYYLNHNNLVKKNSYRIKDKLQNLYYTGKMVNKNIYNRGSQQSNTPTVWGRLYNILYFIYIKWKKLGKF